jgi:hypothetical protein
VHGDFDNTSVIYAICITCVIQEKYKFFNFYFCPALKLTVSISLTIWCIVCLHSTIGAGYFVFTKVSAFSP